PQLQHSIRLLQLSTIELNQEVERLLQENPLLERAEAEEDGARGDDFPLAGPNRVSEMSERMRDVPDSNAPEARTAHDDAPDSADFTDYGSGGGEGDWGGGTSEDDDFFPQQVATSTLRDHLNEQLATMNLPQRDR